MQQVKSRDLSILDFLKVLTDEYFLAEMRSKTYKRKSDRNYWLKVCRFKKDKIEDIALRNRLPSIFNNQDLYVSSIDSYFPKGEICQLIKNSKDLRSYYSIDADVTISLPSGVVETGRIEDVDLSKGHVWVCHLDNQESKQYRLHQIRRIL